MSSPTRSALIGVLAFAILMLTVVLTARVSSAATAPLGPAAAANPIPPGVVIVGEATVDAPADTAYLAFAIQAGGTTGAEVQGQLGARIDRILARAKELGIADHDVVRGPLNVQPLVSGFDAKRGGQLINGFTAYQQFAVESHDLGATAKLLEALMKEDGASTLSVRYTPDPEGPAFLAARGKAVADARSKAAVAAAAAGVRLGGAVSISEIPAQPQPYGVAVGKFPTVGGPGFPPAQIDTVVRLQVQFAFAP